MIMPITITATEDVIGLGCVNVLLMKLLKAGKRVTSKIAAIVVIQIPTPMTKIQLNFKNNATFLL